MTTRRRIAGLVGVAALMALISGCATDLGTLTGGAYSEATDINAGGDIVGWSTMGPTDGSWPQHAFMLHPGGRVIDIDGENYASGASAVNDSGTVAGWVIATQGDLRHAFQWKAGAGMIDLGTLSGDASSSAVGINRDGWIVGSSTNERGLIHGFVRNPTGTDSFAPERATRFDM